VGKILKKRNVNPMTLLLYQIHSPVELPDSDIFTGGASKFDLVDLFRKEAGNQFIYYEEEPIKIDEGRDSSGCGVIDYDEMGKNGFTP